MDNASSQCRTLLGNSWNALLTETRQRPRAEGGTPSKSGGFRPGKCTWENAAAFASDVYKGFQRKEQAVAVAIDLEDAYNRVHSRDLLIHYRVILSLPLISLEWAYHKDHFSHQASSMSIQQSPGRCEPNWTHSFSHWQMTGSHKTSKDSQEAAEAVRHLDSVSK